MSDQSTAFATRPSFSSRVDLGDAPDTHLFYGRTEELNQLDQWLVPGQCRLVEILGLGGIGKTALAAELTRRVAGSADERFEYIIWRSLHNAPAVEDILKEWLLFLADSGDYAIPSGIHAQIDLLIDRLGRHRCLLILDNLEAILREGVHAGTYQPGAEPYGKILRRVCGADHQSCLLITSREIPPELVAFEQAGDTVKPLQLTGLKPDDVKYILNDKGLSGSPESWNQLVDTYSGNPLALKIISETIRHHYMGDIDASLNAKMPIFGGIRDLLEQQFARLSEQEKAIMYWLMIRRETSSIADLQADIFDPQTSKVLPEVVMSLCRRSLMDTTAAGLIVPTVVMEFLNERFIQEVCAEIDHGTPRLLCSHALIQAQAHAYVRASQIRLILMPIAERLLEVMRTHDLIDQTLNEILDTVRRQPDDKHDYAGGNILNLLCYLHPDGIQNFDFSCLTVRQADLRKVELHDVNLEHSDLRQSAFAETFGSVLSLAFSPGGHMLAAGSCSNEIYVWGTADGQRRFVGQGHTAWVWSVAFSPDGRTIASGSGDQTIRLWDAETGICQKILPGHEGRVWSVDISPDGNLLASGSSDQTVRLWNVATGELLTTLRDHQGGVTSVAFHPNGRTLASASEDRSVKLWDISTGICYTTLHKHEAAVWSIAFSPNGRLLASGSIDHTVMLWDVKTETHKKTLREHTGRVRSVKFTRDGSLLITGSEDNLIKLWDVATGKSRTTLQGHTNWVYALAVSPDGHTFASSGNDQTVQVWNTRTIQPLQTWRGYTSQIWSVAFSPDGRWLASGDDNIVRLWDISTKRCVKRYLGHSNRIWSVAFSPDGHTLASGSEDKVVKLWDVATGRCRQTLAKHAQRVRSVVFSPVARRLASCSEDHTVLVWSLVPRERGKPEQLIELEHTDWVWSVAFSPDGRVVASGSSDGVARLWSVQPAQCEQELHGHIRDVLSVAFSPDGSLLASGSGDRTIGLWDTNPAQLYHQLLGHIHRVCSVAFSPDGRFLASGSEDRTVRLWDVATCECLQILSGHSKQVTSVAFSPDGHLLASSSVDETIRIWDVGTGEHLGTLRSDRPYERMRIIGAKEITQAQISVLKQLGAIAEPTT